MDARDFKQGDRVVGPLNAIGRVTSSSNGTVRAFYEDKTHTYPKGKRSWWEETYDAAWFAEYGDRGYLRKLG